MLNIERQIIRQGPDLQNMTEWFTPRGASLADGSAVLLLTRSTLTGSDVFLGTHQLRSADGGRTWTEPARVEVFDRYAGPDGTVWAPADLVPTYHCGSGKVLACGHAVSYESADARHPIVDNRHPRPTVWTVWDPAEDAWTAPQPLGPLAEQDFYWCSAGAAQRVELPDGELLQPVSAIAREKLHDSIWKTCFYSTVLRCRFDGRTLSVIQQGNTLSVPDVRGLYEPSLVCFGGRYLLTLRNDVRGYVSTSEDGLDYQPPRPWTFDDGAELGSYNTQQHWAVVGGRLYLVYTRRGAGNDHLVRHRAPLFLAEVDPERLVVVRETETVLLPERGGVFGNGGVTQVSEREAWVTDAELMLADAKDTYNIELSAQRGANNRVYLARLTAEG